MSNYRNWAVTLSAIFAGIVIAVIQNKVIPCLTVLQDAFSLSMSSAGWLSSIFCVMSILAAFPAAIITNRLGSKKVCICSLACAGIGSVMGLLSKSAMLLMLSRIIEGIGAGLISVAVPSIIAVWFPPEKRGLPTGLWSSWQFVAQALCFFFGSTISGAFGWQGIWYTGLILIAAAIALSVIFIRAPGVSEGYAAERGSESVSILQGLRSPSSWFACAAMLCFCFDCFGFVTWAAACWAETLGMRLDAANRYISLFAIISLPVVIVVGILLNHVDYRKFCMIACFGYIFAVSAAFILPNAKWVLLFVVIYPLFEGSVSTALWAIIPQTVRETKYVSAAVALFTLTSNVGMLIGPPIVGAVIEQYSWRAAMIPLSASMILGTVLICLTKLYKN